MILQELYRYYQRKNEEGELPPPGFEKKEIHYTIVIDNKGNFVRFESNIYKEGDEEKVRTFLVPASIKRSSNIAANLLWDNISYVLGESSPGEKEDPKRLKQQKNEFYKRVEECLEQTKEKSLAAVLAFAQVNKKTYTSDPLWKEIINRKTGANLSFKLHGEKELVCAKKTIINYVIKSLESSHSEGELYTCLISGEKTEIAEIHPAIKGVYGGQPTGTNIVSFNLSAFESYGKKRSYNAPVGKYAAFAYTSALNSLLAKDSTQKLQVGGSTVVFWSEKKTEFENEFASFFEFKDADKNLENKVLESRALVSLRKLLESPQRGKMGTPEKEMKFFVLALAPNAGRLAIRFWYQASIAEVENNLRQYFLDLQTVHPPYLSEVLPLRTLLRSTAVAGKDENIHPLMATGLFSAILSNKPFPRVVLSSVVERIRAEPSASYEFEYSRAALIKAYINRLVRARQYNTKLLEDKMDETNTSIAYRLGRLFAVLEYLQARAIGNPNASIRDRYYAAASSRPAVVFPILLNLANHHISKIGWGDKLIEDILMVFPAENPFPRSMTLEEQGLFAVGYYQQKQVLYAKKVENEGGKDE
ncbi:MAG: type I-C CRISPR-associated protein Cas8c/Csd1 [Leptospiraceae bacterium]|nr:type I-C CRISPR-associated protein Cas8c/Csd1 [Leptospiraceae bacterium]